MAAGSAAAAGLVPNENPPPPNKAPNENPPPPAATAAVGAKAAPKPALKWKPPPAAAGFFRVSDSNPNTEFAGVISIEPSLTGAPTPGSLARIR